MQKKRRNIFWYFFAPIVLEWAVSFVVQIAAEIFYIFQNISWLEQAVNEEANFTEYMNEMILVLNQHATEITILIAVCASPFLFKMYKKDRREVQEWWQTNRKLGGKEITLIIILSACVCVAANNFILLSGIMNKSEAYIETAQSIYGASAIVQLIGVGIFVPIMEEMVYRGLLYRRMREYLSFPVCMIGTALLFGIYHGNSVQLIYASVLGAFLAYLFEEFRSLKAPVLFHISANITSLVCSWFGVFSWIFSNIYTVMVVTVFLCVSAAMVVMMLKYYENVK